MAAWNVRPSPARARRCAGSELTSSPEELDGAVGRHEAADRVEQRRLAGAVGADEADHLAGLGAEVDVVDGDDAAEAHGEPVRREHAAVGVERERAAASRPA